MPNVDGVLLGPGPLAVAVTRPYSATYLWSNGNYCTHDGKIYKFIGEDLVEGEAWTAAHWSEIKLTDAILNLQDQIDAMSPESATGVFLDVEFHINSNQWTAGTNVWTYNLSNTLIKASSGIAVYYEDSFRTALSGDIKVQKYTGYVTFTTTGQPQGTLDGTLRIIQSVSGILPVSKGGTGAATAKAARQNLNAPIKPIELSFGTVTSLPQTVYDPDITETMVPIAKVLSNPAACPKGLTLTLNGSGTPSATISLEGSQTFSGETTVTIYIEDKKTRDDDATNQQQEQYVGDFVQVGAQTLTTQQQTQARTNIGAVSTSVVGDVPSGKTVQGEIDTLNGKITKCPVYSSISLENGSAVTFTFESNTTFMVQTYRANSDVENKNGFYIGQAHNKSSIKAVVESVSISAISISGRTLSITANESYVSAAIIQLPFLS